MFQKSVSGTPQFPMTYTRAQKAMKHGVSAAPLKRSEVGDIARAVKSYKLKNDITINNRRQRRKTE
jgi:hypothetical protein